MTSTVHTFYINFIFNFEIIYRALKIKRKLPNSKIVHDVHEHYPDMVKMSKKVSNLIKPLATFKII
jgi:hypothetical protein